jgi:hypothetical protein
MLLVWRTESRFPTTAWFFSRRPAIAEENSWARARLPEIDTDLVEYEAIDIGDLLDDFGQG